MALFVKMSALIEFLGRFSDFHFMKQNSEPRISWYIYAAA